MSSSSKATTTAGEGPPDLQDVLTQHTEVLAGMLAELRAREGPAPVANAAEPPEDPDFDWSSLVMPPETSFQVPGNGQVQRIASSLLTRVPTLAGRDQHEARFVLQVISLWPDLHEEERFWAFQRLILLHRGCLRMAPSYRCLRLNFYQHRLRPAAWSCSTVRSGTTPDEKGLATTTATSGTTTPSSATAAPPTAAPTTAESTGTEQQAWT